MTNAASPPSSQEIFDRLCSAKGEIARLVAADLGYIGVPRYEHIHAASLMVEATMLAMDSDPRFMTINTPLEKAIRKYIELDREYSAATALAD
jgi:hypothetical protein